MASANFTKNTAYKFNFLYNHMEFLDIVDDNDEVLGNAPKQEIYEKLLTHRIVHILIFNNKGEMALQLQGRNKKFCPLHWSTAVGGHVQAGESYEQAAIRECEEELGKRVKPIFAFKDVFRAGQGIKKFLVTFTSDYNGPFNPNEKEVENVEFFTMQKIREMINAGEKFHPELLFLLKKHYGIK